MNPHVVALLMIVVGTGVGTLLLADAAEEAARRRRESRRSALLRQRPSRLPFWGHPVALQCASLGFLAIMTLSGAVLVYASPW